ncbi:alkB, alkylation repair protein 6 [Sporormia fimetaria CBS 119925]|uniref:AlkB, alkylation repair protein 6 n=1 Tax=Sporormia fimetaria CBS 119925 TaxID=1340428 RepID=A0A6A6VBG0_9PLEO|nr:alkB, alkylation repair protein 6 [Sporormia fimetaria CBS 119925]
MSISSDDRDPLRALEAFRIPHLSPNMYYIPDFITMEEETSILNKIPAQRWVVLSHRRLQAHPSQLTSGNTLFSAPLAPYLVTPIMDRFKDLGIFQSTPHGAPNHVLVNEYKRGEGIMMHEDGAAYAHIVATVSLGGTLCLDLARKRQEVEEEIPDAVADGYKLPTRILQESRSLLITTGLAYTDLLHGIADIEVDENLGKDSVANWDLLSESSRKAVEDAGGRNERGTRVSLTYRDVLKTSSGIQKVLGHSLGWNKKK